MTQASLMETNSGSFLSCVDTGEGMKLKVEIHEEEAWGMREGG